MIVFLLVWLDSWSCYLWDMYCLGMVMEQWNLEICSYDCYVIDWVMVQSYSLILWDVQGEMQVVCIFFLDSSWLLFWLEKMLVVDGE